MALQFKINHPAWSFFSPKVDQPLSPTDSVLFSGTANDPEYGNISPEMYLWSIDRQQVLTGQKQFFMDGLAPGAHEVSLSVTDKGQHNITVTQSFTISPLSISSINVIPILDGNCDEYGIDNKTIYLPLKPYSTDRQAYVSLFRTSDSLWICFQGLKHSSRLSRVIVSLDRDSSGGLYAQSTDGAYTLGEDGFVGITTGDGVGGFNSVPSTAISFQSGVSNITSDIWNAEFKIPVDRNQLRLFLSHLIDQIYYTYPSNSVFNSPNTWATTVLLP